MNVADGIDAAIRGLEVTLDDDAAAVVADAGGVEIEDADALFRAPKVKAGRARRWR